MAVLQVRIDDELRDALAEIARAESERIGRPVTVSDVARNALERRVNLFRAKTALTTAFRGEAPAKHVVQPIAVPSAPVLQPIAQEPLERGVGWTDGNL